MSGHGSRERAEHLLAHYFRTAFTATGVTWDSDNETEVQLIVDYLLAAAKEQAQEVAGAEIDTHWGRR